MERSSSSTTLPLAKPDIVLPILPADERQRLADDYEKHHNAEDPQLLRKAVFGIVGALAHSPLDKRDASIEKDAQTVQKSISSHYPNEETREQAFLYNIMLAVEKPAKDDRYPFRELYSPVERLRAAMAQNSEKQKVSQQTSEELAKKEAALSREIMDLQRKLDETRAQKASQLAEMVMIVQANKTLVAHSACHAIALQANRDRLIATTEASITQFIALKEKLSKAQVDHEKKNLSEQLQTTETTIENDIKALWFCMHYLQRIHSADGSVGAIEEVKWRIGSIDPTKLGISNYQQFLEAKSK